MTAIGIVRTDSQVSTAQHNRRVVLNAAGRGPFLLLLKSNFWGLATILSKTAFEVDKATTDSQSAPNYWWDVQARWRNAWWNLGGTWSKFVSAVNSGKNKKPILIKYAPSKIKDKLKAKGIGSIGIGAVDPATLTAAASIIAALTPLILSTINLVKGKQQTGLDFTPVDTESDTDFSFGLTDEAGNITTAGYGLIGVGVLGLLLLGTKGKKKLF